MKDTCVFYKSYSDAKAIMIVYVDDLIIITLNITIITKIKEEIERKFKTKDLGGINYVLGV